MDKLLLYCRPGFEKECAAEIQTRSEALGGYGYCRTCEGSGYVLFDVYQGGERLTGLRLADLVFARQLVRRASELSGLDPDDRLSGLATALQRQAWRFGEIRLEYPDTNAGKVLSPLARSLQHLLASRLTREHGHRPGSEGLPALHVFFHASTAAVLGLSGCGDRSPWLNGVPRLKMPRAAPSRSTLKLEEALLTLLSAQERERHLQPGMTAVDLGAAPGGWSWQMTRRSIRVTAVDNGAMASRLMDTGLVEHVRADGFRYRPPRPVDWLLCDMVEQPRRIAVLVAEWLALGACRRAVFNLKLPMKRRFEEVQLCRERIVARLNAAGVAHRLRLRQLYHDREEVTGYLCRL